jgi:hypothetical protein
VLATTNPTRLARELLNHQYNWSLTTYRLLWPSVNIHLYPTAEVSILLAPIVGTQEYTTPAAEPSYNVYSTASAFVLLTRDVQKNRDIQPGILQLPYHRTPLPVALKLTALSVAASDK